MDRLEDHIRKHREELDSYSPSPENWNAIRKSMRIRKFGLNRWLSTAAMIVVILTTAALFYKGEIKKNIFNTRDANALLMRINPQFRETEIYYNNLLDNLLKEATPLLTSHPEIKNELFNDISQLDSLCADIKNDLKDNIDNQEIIEALIVNYRIKTEILEDMLNHLKLDDNNPQKNDTYAL